jgi:two-component system KDP operon response regulator KdpE
VTIQVSTTQQRDAATPGQATMTQILVVEDEPQILRALMINLRARKYEARSATSGTEALLLAAKHPPGLVLLDLGLPDMDGIEVIAGLRGWMQAPIIVLSGRTSSLDKVQALDAGADDYVSKPFDMDELMARVRAAARRASLDSAPEVGAVQIGQHRVDLAAHTVTNADGEHVHLTRTEWELLHRLLRHPNQLITQRQLLTEIWGPDPAADAAHLRFHFGQLRRKLETDPSQPRHLITEPGLGYRYAE